jgi:hypothetical protein
VDNRIKLPKVAKLILHTVYPAEYPEISLLIFPLLRLVKAPWVIVNVSLPLYTKSTYAVRSTVATHPNPGAALRAEVHYGYQANRRKGKAQKRKFARNFQTVWNCHAQRIVSIDDLVHNYEDGAAFDLGTNPTIPNPENPNSDNDGWLLFHQLLHEVVIT